MSRLLPLLLLLAGCQVAGPDAGTDLRTYAYAALDGEGNQVAEGSLNLTFAAPGGICAGKRDFCPDYVVEGRVDLSVDPQSPHSLGSADRLRASLKGSASDGPDSLSVYFGVEVGPDRGLHIRGRYDGASRDALAGTWTYCTFGGCFQGGTFTASR